MVLTADLVSGTPASDWCVCCDFDGIKWFRVKAGPFQGARVILDGNTKQVEVLSTRYCKDNERWRQEDMPSFTGFTGLKVLDLHGNRYMIELDNSLCDLVHLRRLILSRCDRLERLPSNLGNLQQLREVSGV